MSERMIGPLNAPTAREGIEGLLRAASEQFCSDDGPRGCLVLLGALNCTRANKKAHDRLYELRQQGVEIIRQRLTRAVSEGDLPAGAPVAEIASFYTTLLHGLAVRARDGASRQVLMAAVDAAMGAWDPLVGKKRAAATRHPAKVRRRTRRAR
jgi:hypothetical protein